MRPLAALLLTLCCLFPACSSDETEDSTPVAPCQPGAIVACACGPGQVGTQRCLNDATGFDACRCEDGAGGQSGGAGQSGSAGQAGLAGASGAAAGAGTSGSGGSAPGGSAGIGGSSGQGGAAGMGGAAGGQGGAAGEGGNQAGNAGAGGLAGEGGAAGQGGSPVTMALWPDSATAFCSDGAVAIDCPAAGEAAHGQDGNFLDTTADLVAGGGEVRDGLTGLVWQQSDLPPGSLAKATGYCANKAAVSMLDWRVPTLRELASLLDYGRHDAAADMTVFPGLVDTPYWTLSPSPVGSHWLVEFKDGGFVTNGVFGAIRCVRGAAPGWDQPLVAQGEVVLDPGTGLLWQSAPGPAAGWVDALAQCNALSLGGLSGWRLPSIKQLETLGFQSGTAEFAVAFPPVGGDAFWSSTPRASAPSEAWALDLAQLGLAFTTAIKGATHQVRCVRPASP